MLQVIVLGCGASLGVPVIGCNCSVCRSDSSYNKRTRSSIYIDDGNSQILVDFGFDIRTQLLRENISKIDGAILTHDHADHVGGIDNLRIFPFMQKKPLEIYTDNATSVTIENRYKYLFSPSKLIAKPLGFYAKFQIKTIEVQFLKQYHAPIDSLGIRINGLVYSSDVAGFPEESKELLKDIKVWILDCMDYQSNESHAGLDRVLEWNDLYKPGQILLTNMRHTIDYHKVSQKLPPNIKPLYDGYKFTV